MAQKNLFYALTEKMFNTFTDVGFNSVTYGSEGDADIQKRLTDYPFSHTNLSNISIEDKATTLSFNIIVGDKVDQTNTTQINKYAKDNTIDIQQDLLNKMSQFLVDLQELNLESYDDLIYGYDLDKPVSAIAFRNDLPNILTGFFFILNVEVPNMADLC